MKKSNDPIPGIKKEFDEGWQALGCLVVGILLSAATFLLIFTIIKHLRP